VTQTGVTPVTVLADRKNALAAAKSRRLVVALAAGATFADQPSRITSHVLATHIPNALPRPVGDLHTHRGLRCSASCESALSAAATALGRPAWLVLLYGFCHASRHLGAAGGTGSAFLGLPLDGTAGADCDGMRRL
jgi:hypothetical protein